MAGHGRARRSANCRRLLGLRCLAGLARIFLFARRERGTVEGRKPCAWPHLARAPGMDPLETRTVLRLLHAVATADGSIGAEERRALTAAAEELRIGARGRRTGRHGRRGRPHQVAKRCASPRSRPRSRSPRSTVAAPRRSTPRSSASRAAPRPRPPHARRGSRAHVGGSSCGPPARRCTRGGRLPRAREEARRRAGRVPRARRGAPSRARSRPPRDLRSRAREPAVLRRPSAALSRARVALETRGCSSRARTRSGRRPCADSSRRAAAGSTRSRGAQPIAGAPDERAHVRGPCFRSDGSSSRRPPRRGASRPPRDRGRRWSREPDASPARAGRRAREQQAHLVGGAELEARDDLA